MNDVVKARATEVRGFFGTTDGIPEMVGPDDDMMGERAFLISMAEVFIDFDNLAEIRDQLTL